MLSEQEASLPPAGEQELLDLIDEVERERISRKQFVYRALGLGLSASAVSGLLAACGKKSEPGATTAANTIGPTTAPKELYLFNWSEYMAPGVKKDFQKETGIKVVESYYDDNEQLLSKLKGGATGYDLIVPTDYMVHIMIKSQLLEPLVMDYIPNMKYVDAQFQTPVYDDPAENGGLKYSTPKDWGTTGYAVRTDKLDPASVGRWADLFPPDGQPYKDQIQMLNDERDCMTAGLKFVGVRDTGTAYSANTTDPSQVDAATQALIDQKPLVRDYSSTDRKRPIVEGLPITMCWNGDALLAISALGGDQKAKSLVKFLLPQEGFAIWVDNFCIPKGFKSKYAAHLFMDYMLKPEVQGKSSSWTWYLPVGTEAARPYCDPFVYITMPTPEEMKRGEITNDLGDFARYYTDAWAKVKSA